MAFILRQVHETILEATNDTEPLSGFEPQTLDWQSSMLTTGPLRTQRYSVMPNISGVNDCYKNKPGFAALHACIHCTKQLNATDIDSMKPLRTETK